MQEEREKFRKLKERRDKLPRNTKNYWDIIFLLQRRIYGSREEIEVLQETFEQGQKPLDILSIG